MPEPTPSTRPLLLVVEDEALVRMTLVDVLEDAGFKVIEAVHADEALRVLSAVSGIDAVITDVEMPRGSINGFELARRVRTDRQEIGVLIASGRAAPKPGDLPEGALFIGKPVHPETLVQLIRRLLGPIQD
ncbi:response regulator [Microvirga sp. CF3016]|uniref:response regulator n=1 Tax=Microvirga sp. CF3016 TaxID=3110181 RepID=UPI002E786980|nr:response regulator [Microvirga sp. CF3016]MEE1611910.1 response regulator [Microvirga sp. CF3016]